ncbi:MAG: hypothetical protein JRJ51_10680 [Deltaproteobacteria bacterium]|nr:hypothetical protein [Deltaproteobacteria bacterium]
MPDRVRHDGFRTFYEAVNHIGPPGRARLAGVGFGEVYDSCFGPSIGCFYGKG